MLTGMLWLINNAKSLGDNVAQAASHYEKKYGRMPTLCLVNPKDISQKPELQDGPEEKATALVVVRPYRPVLPGHLWIVVEDEPGTKM